MMKVFKKKLEPNNADLTCYILDNSEEMETAKIRPAALIFPGGGYQTCTDREAEPVALAYMAEGFHAFVLRYTTAQDKAVSRALEDAQAALTYIRTHAEELNVDAEKVAVVGFSAGGHLAALLGTDSQEKPNALILGYPVIKSDYLVTTGKENISAEENVTKETPPAFIFASSDDMLVPVENSLVFAKKLSQQGVYFELHVYLSGEHGISLGKSFTADGDSELVNRDMESWFGQNIRFLKHVWGDFTIYGEKNIPIIQRRKRYGIDMPIGELIEKKACVDIIEKFFPGIVAQLNYDPLGKSITFRQLERCQIFDISLERLLEMNEKLEACNF